MPIAPKASARPVSSTPAPTRVCGQTAGESEVVIVMVPERRGTDASSLASRRPFVKFSSNSTPGGVALLQAYARKNVEGQTMPDLTMVARRLAKSSSTNLANASPDSTAGVQSFFLTASAQLGDF